MSNNSNVSHASSARANNSNGGGSRSLAEAPTAKSKKGVRKAIKNARGLISDLFAREKFSFWMIYNYNDVQNGAGSRGVHNRNASCLGGAQRPPSIGRPPQFPLYHRQDLKQQQQQLHMLHQRKAKPNQASSSVQASGNRDARSKTLMSPVPQELEHEVDQLDSIGSLSETEAIAEERRRTALDTLSTIDSDDNWDEFERTSPVLGTFDDVAAEVMPQLFVGAFMSEQNKEELDRKKMTHILQVGDNLTRSYEGAFEYKTITIADSESANLLAHFRECFSFIEEAKNAGGGTGCVLVHCFAGISRSATVCIGYLMWKLSLSLGAAYSLVESARSCAQPNEGFRRQLEIFENFGGDLDMLDSWIEQRNDEDLQPTPRSNSLASSVYSVVSDVADM